MAGLLLSKRELHLLADRACLAGITAPPSRAAPARARTLSHPPIFQPRRLLEPPLPLARLGPAAGLKPERFINEHWVQPNNSYYSMELPGGIKFIALSTYVRLRPWGCWGAGLGREGRISSSGPLLCSAAQLAHVASAPHEHEPPRPAADRPGPH